MAGGASPRRSHRLALAEFRGGNVLAKYMAPLRQAHAPSSITLGAPTGHVLTDLWQDLRYAARMLRKQPGFAAVAVLTLALGIGATTAIFSVVYGVLLKPLPFHEPDRLVGCLSPRRNQSFRSRSGPGHLFHLSRQQPGVRGHRRMGLHAGLDHRAGEPERVEALSVTDGTLPLLRVQPVLGRLFSKEDDAPASPPRVVLTHGYWQRRFGGARGHHRSTAA